MTILKKKKEKKGHFSMHSAFTVYVRMAIQILVRHTAGKVLSLVHIDKKFRLFFTAFSLLEA